ncbi:hypothetical protein L0N19_19785, partial [[Eubacterium] rectale]|uniref:hypothetical protein n=1 Tax=Agathobacter rectalis TaxID=39491 RepID=UPI0027D24FC0
RKITWGRKWQPTPVFLPGKSHGQRNLVGYCPWGLKESATIELASYSPWGCKELDTTEHLLSLRSEDSFLQQENIIIDSYSLLAKRKSLS